VNTANANHSNTPQLHCSTTPCGPFEDEDSLPDVAFAVEGRELCGQRSRDDEDEYD